MDSTKDTPSRDQVYWNGEENLFRSLGPVADAIVLKLSPHFLPFCILLSVIFSNSIVMIKTQLNSDFVYIGYVQSDSSEVETALD